MSPRARRLTQARFVGWRVLLALIAVAALYGGIKLRWRLYHDSDVIRFRGDIQNAWHQGSEIYKSASVIAYARQHNGATTQPTMRTPIAFRDYFTALRGRYDALLTSVAGDDYGLDYPPARLLIMSSWVWHSRNTLTVRPIPPPWESKLVAPLLRLNTTFEALAAVALFLIIRRVTLLDGSPHAATLGLTGALLIWFSLPALLDGHVWPQWDNWVLPFYLWSCWFALRGNWKLCGALLALGAMCKGQMLMITPALLLWPLLRGKFLAAGDLLLGFFAAGLAFTAPWLLNNADAVRLCIAMLALGIGAVCIQRRIRFRWMLLVWNAALLGSGMALGSIAWYLVGFAYGARHFHMMSTIGAIPNLAALLTNQFGWQPDNVILQWHWLHWQPTTRELLVALNAVGVVVCGVALALQSRWQSRRILLALALPWLTTACLMPQMHERYLLWAGSMTALAVGVSFGTTLIHLLLALWATVPIAAGLLYQVRVAETPPPLFATLHSWLDALNHCWPADAFSVLTLMLIWLYLSLTPGRRTIDKESRRATMMA